MSVSDSESVSGVDDVRRDYLLDVWPELLHLETGKTPLPDDSPDWDDECSEFDWSNSDPSTDSLPERQRQ
jgi:hypothetical protein